MTRPKNAGAIGRWGLRARKPVEHNYKFIDSGWIHEQPEGVYCTVQDHECGQWNYQCGPKPREYRVHWCGPIMNDPYLERELIANPALDDQGTWAVCIPMNVPPECLAVVVC